LSKNFSSRYGLGSLSLSKMDTVGKNDVLGKLQVAETAYKRNKPKKWLVVCAFLLFGYLLGNGIPSIINKLSKASYDRASLENIMKNLLGDYYITDALSDELLIVAFDYNSQEPRFFSKYFSKEDPGIYNITIGNATAASSAAPTFFDPKL
jgi:hypothetical protein